MSYANSLLTRRPWLLCLGSGLVLSLLVGLVAAHPLGSFTISHFARLAVGSETLSLRYVVDFAEISTFQELDLLDTNHDRTLAPAEYAAYAERSAQTYREKFTLTLDGLPVPLQLKHSSARLQRGDGGLSTLRVECEFTGAWVKATTARRLRFEDGNGSDRSGWREVVVEPLAGVAVFDSTAFGNGLTEELKVYPPDLAKLPLNERGAEFSFVHGVVPVKATPLQLRDGRPVALKQRDRLAELIAVPELTPSLAALGLLIALLLGSLHAMSPGHGKTVVGAYLVGSRGTWQHAAFLGLTVTVTHTAGVFALGLVTLFGARYIVPEKLFPVLSFISGALIVGLGVQQFWQRLRRARRNTHPLHTHGGVVHTHDDSEAHAHDHGPHGHSHLPPTRVTWRSLLALGISGGLLPCPSALVVLLSAISLQRVAYGLLLVLAFSAGLAAMLTAVGLAFLYARRWLERPALSSTRGLVQALPVVSALVITCAGVAICWQTLAPTGLTWGAILAFIGMV